MRDATPQYIVRTPDNPKYDGKTYGVQFANGAAYLAEATIPEWIERTVDEVAQLMLTEFHLEVTGITPEAKANVKEWQAKLANAPAVRSGYPLKTPKPKKNAVVRGEGVYRVEANNQEA